MITATSGRRRGRRGGRRGLMALAFGLALAVPVLGSAQAAPKADLWERWQAHDPASTRQVDHGAWTGFLQRYVQAAADGVNRVAYGAVTPGDRDLLRHYLGHLAAQPLSSLSRAEQQAYWINLYNALTVSVVLEAYPVQSIRDIDISPGLFSDGPWGKKLLAVEGEEVSLDDIEHRILRPIWRDPRIHYAVNCASIGCPNLLTTAFTAENSEALLDKAARAYINHPRGAEVSGGRLVVSSIYDWFESDFGDGDVEVIAHLRRHAEPALLAALAGIDSIADDRYDWSLNGLGPSEVQVNQSPSFGTVGRGGS